MRTTIELAHQLGLSVVAEGVETDEVLERLIGLGCEYAQGYGIAKPLPAPEFLPWLAQWRAGDAAGIVPFVPRGDGRASGGAGKNSISIGTFLITNPRGSPCRIPPFQNAVPRNEGPLAARVD